MFSRMSHKTLALALILTAIGAAASATAGQPETSSRTLSVAGLDLASPDGAAELDRRISVAAARLCRVEGRSLADRERAADCRAKAITDASEQAKILVVQARNANRYAMNNSGAAAVR